MKVYIKEEENTFNLAQDTANLNEMTMNMMTLFCNSRHKKNRAKNRVCVT